MLKESCSDLPEQMSLEEQEEILGRAIDRLAADRLKVEIEWSVARELARRKKFRALQVYLTLLAIQKHNDLYSPDLWGLDMDGLRPVLIRLLGISKVTLWRALKELLQLGLVYYEEFGINDIEFLLFVRDHADAAYMLGCNKIIGVRQVHFHHIASIHNLKALLTVMPATIPHPLTKRQIAEQLGVSVRSVKRYRREFQKEYEKQLYEDEVFDNYQDAIEFRDNEKHPDYDGLTFAEVGYRTAPVKREDGKYVLWRSSAATVKVNGIGPVVPKTTALHRDRLHGVIKYRLLKRPDSKSWDKMPRPRRGRRGRHQKIDGFDPVPFLVLDGGVFHTARWRYMFGPVLEYFEKTHAQGRRNGPVPNEIFWAIQKRYQNVKDALDVADLMNPRRYLYLKDLGILLGWHTIYGYSLSYNKRISTAPRIWDRWWLREPSMEEFGEAVDIDWGEDDPLKELLEDDEEPPVEEPPEDDVVEDEELQVETSNKGQRVETNDWWTWFEPNPPTPDDSFFDPTVAA